MTEKPLFCLLSRATWNKASIASNSVVQMQANGGSHITTLVTENEYVVFSLCTCVCAYMQLICMCVCACEHLNVHITCLPVLLSTSFSLNLELTG